MGISLIRRALEKAICVDYINQSAFEHYLNMFSPDKRFKLSWLAADSYRKGCSSGIVKYAGQSYYFSLANGSLEVEYN